MSQAAQTTRTEARRQGKGGSGGSYDPYSAARAIVGRLSESAPRSESLRRLDEDAVAAIKGAGLARLLTPKEFGGHELPLRAQVLTCAITARGCSAASWVQMVCGAHNYVAGRYPAKCREEVFGDDPDVLIPGTLAAQGTVKRVDGGWIVDGRWQFGSGIDHGPWLIFGARGIDDPKHGSAPNMHVIVPKSDVEVVDTWYTLGMRGTGSKDLVVKELFVPDYRAMPTVELFLGTFDNPVEPVYRLPVLGGLATMLSGSVLGMAERGLEEFVDYTRVRQDIYGSGAKARRVSMQLRVAESSSEIQLARKLVEESCDIFDAALADDNPPLGVEVRAQLKWNAGYAVELCRRAIERIFAASGAHSIYDTSKLQNVYRDINTACHHAIADFDGAAEVRGRLILGLDEGDLPV